MTGASGPRSAVPNATTKAAAERGVALGATIRRATADDTRAIARVRVDASRATCAAIAAARHGHGASALLTWVIAANRGARAFYEGPGAAFVVERPFLRDGPDLIEIANGWHDPGASAAASARSPRQ